MYQINLQMYITMNPFDYFLSQLFFSGMTHGNMGMSPFLQFF